MVTLQVKFRPYRRSFRHPLRTVYGEWQAREGILLRLADRSGKTGWGEIAPLPWFGSETLEQAREFCHQLQGEMPPETIASIPDSLPCCQFGFESALEWLNLKVGEERGNDDRLSSGAAPDPVDVMRHNGCLTPAKVLPDLPHSWLLPAGEAALEAWKVGWQQGYRTFKWKLGVGTIATELATFQALMHSLPAATKLRLDANGSLTPEAAHTWLSVCDQFPTVEFLEQPLPPQNWEGLLQLSQEFATPIALDESVASLQDLQTCYASGWRGIFVVKPAIVGSPSRLRSFCRDHSLDVVCSSVFETSIGQWAALHLAGELMAPERAIGFGVEHWFANTNPLVWADPEALWHHLLR